MMFNCTPFYADEQPLFPSDTKPPSSFNYVSPNSKLDPPFSFYHFSPTFTLEHNNNHDHDHDHDHYHGHLLPQQQPVTANNSLVTTAGIVIDMAISNKKSRMTNSDVNALHPNYNASTATSLKPNLHQKKRSAKRDRHSKIVTAQGIRDRRMRLSLDVAPEFFGLQDLRGDDKPSKTIRWLLNQCKGAIKEFSRAKELPKMQNCRNVPEKKALANNESKRERRKTKFHHIGRESREKARARARERTIEKKRGRRSEYGAEERPQKRKYLSPSETGEKSEISHSDSQMKSSMAVVAEVEEPNLHLLEFQGPSQNTAGDHVVTTSKSGASSIFSYQHDIAILQGFIASTSASNSTTNENHVPSFFENWDNDGTRAYSCYSAKNNPYPSKGNVQDRISSSSVFLTTSEYHMPCHLSEIRNFGKPWEVYNN